MHRPREAGAWNRFGVIVRQKQLLWLIIFSRVYMSRPNRAQDVTMLKKHFVFRLLAIAHSAFLFFFGFPLRSSSDILSEKTL